MPSNPLRQLKKFGQSIWLDSLSRDMLVSGKLQQLIDQDGLDGVTFNPVVFGKAVDCGEYDQAIQYLIQKNKDLPTIYQTLVTEDSQRAADIFRSVFYLRSKGDGGFVNLEVSPLLAHDPLALMVEVRRLWAWVNSPNIFIKIPATPAGLAVMPHLISEGININVLLFGGLPVYGKAVQAYLAGLLKRAEVGLPLGEVESVASFFLSPIDELVDSRLEQMSASHGPNAGLAAELRGQVAIASAKKAYQLYKEIFHGDQFRQLEKFGAKVQRLGWISATAGNPDLGETKYVEALIGPETINLMPLQTLENYRDNGQPAPRLEENPAAAAEVLDRLFELDINLDEIGAQLETEALQRSMTTHHDLLHTLRAQYEQRELVLVAA